MPPQNYSEQPTQQAPARAPAASNAPSDIPECILHLLGSCRGGIHCPMSHGTGVVRGTGTSEINGSDLVVENIQQQHGDSAARMNEAEHHNKNDHYIREIGGAAVEYSDGAFVSKVSFASDFSAVRLTTIPTDVTSNSVSETFARMREPVPVENIHIATVLQNTAGGLLPVPAQVDIRVEDSKFAERVCRRPELRRYSPANVTTTHAALQQLAETNVTSMQWADSKEAHVSWKKMTKTVYLAFLSEEDATHVKDLFDDGYYTVHGRRVESTLQCITVSINTISPAPSVMMAWTIALQNVPARATESDVVNQIPWNAGLFGYDVNLSQLPGLDEAKATTLIQFTIARAASVEWWHDAAERQPAAERQEAKVRFRTEASAAGAILHLNNTPLPFNRSEVLTVKPTPAVRLKVTAAIHRAVGTTLLDCAPAWKNQGVELTTYPETTGHVVIKLEGKRRQAIANAKAELEGILRGGIIFHKDGTTPYWACEFAGSKMYGGLRIQWKIKELQAQYGVVIICDRHMRQVRVVGSRPQQRKASDGLLKYLMKVREDSLANKKFVIALSDEMVQWLTHRGSRIFQEAVGQRNMKIDTFSSPFRVILSNGESYRTALDILTTHPGRTITCCICWTETEDVVTTPCQHDYCRDCFQNLCLTGTNEGIRCVGNGNTCRVPLPLSVVQNNLSWAAFESVLLDAFRGHMQRNTSQLRYCPTPDCGQVYRLSRPSREPVLFEKCFTCLSCMALVCRVCNAVHESMSCADYLDQATGGYQTLERAKSEFGIRHCPSCNTMIQKSGGCNHIACPVCSTHVCWFCMGTFDAAEIYRHMMSEHGGHIDPNEE